jgi:hypothetical protein
MISTPTPTPLRCSLEGCNNMISMCFQPHVDFLTVVTPEWDIQCLHPVGEMQGETRNTHASLAAYVDVNVFRVRVVSVQNQNDMILWHMLSNWHKMFEPNYKYISSWRNPEGWQAAMVAGGTRSRDPKFTFLFFGRIPIIVAQTVLRLPCMR